MKIERETFLAELDVILVDARTPHGAPAYSGFDRQQLLGFIFRHFANDGALIPLDVVKFERARNRLARQREAEKPIFEVVRGTSRAEVAAERAWNEREEREREEREHVFTPIDMTGTVA